MGKNKRDARAAKERGIKKAKGPAKGSNQKKKKNKSPPRWVRGCN
jgi:hypothetical protein